MKKSYLLLPAFFVGLTFGQRSFDGPTTHKNEAKRDGDSDQITSISLPNSTTMVDYKINQIRF